LRELAERDPKQFFALNPGPLILDEIQRVPDLLSWVQVRVDENPEKGQFILTGSHQFRLHEAISQSLAGRTAVHRLLPLSMQEWSQKNQTDNPFQLIYQGLMPRVHQDGLDPTGAYRNYFQTYVERDVRQISEIRNLNLFERFMRLLAGRVGQLVNLHAMSGEVGVSSTTLDQWLSILEASYIVFRLPPYFRNFGKRLVKTPKLYFVEPGLAAWLLGIENEDQAARDPLMGNLFENLIVSELLKARYHHGKDANLYFWRDAQGHEIDVIFEKQRRSVPIEIKAAMTWNEDLGRGLKWFAKNTPESLPGNLIYAGDLFPESGTFKTVGFMKAADSLR
jgi:predicted AAA+ superfamily ATPase